MVALLWVISDILRVWNNLEDHVDGRNELQQGTLSQAVSSSMFLCGLKLSFSLFFEKTTSVRARQQWVTSCKLLYEASSSQMRKSLNLTDLSSLHSNWGEACKDSVNWQDIMMENRQTCINIRTANHENKGKSVIKRRRQVAHFRFTCAHMRLLNVGALLVHCKSSNEGLCLRYRVSWRRRGGWFSPIVWRQAKR